MIEMIKKVEAKKVEAKKVFKETQYEQRLVSHKNVDSYKSDGWETVETQGDRVLMRKEKSND